MRPVSPNTGAPEITVAENQHEYLTITAAVYEWSDGRKGLLTRWHLTDEDKTRIANGEDVYLMMLTFGKPMQPVKIQVGSDGFTDFEIPPPRPVPPHIPGPDFRTPLERDLDDAL